MNFKHLFGAVICAIALTGCQGATFKTWDASNQSVSLDASQRTVLSHNGKLCAEPSPDAMRGMSAQLAAQLDVPLNQQQELEAKLAAGLAQQVASIGIRTATIQLTRDMLYRICEAGLNGMFETQPGRDPVINTQMAASMLLQLDNIILGAHAIDALAQTGKAQQVVLVSGGTATAEDGKPATSNTAATPVILENASQDNASQAGDISKVADNIYKSLFAALQDTYVDPNGKPYKFVTDAMGTPYVVFFNSAENRFVSQSPLEAPTQTPTPQ